MNRVDRVCKVKRDHARPHAVVARKARQPVTILVIGYKRDSLAELNVTLVLPSPTHTDRAIRIKTITSRLSEHQLQSPASSIPNRKLQPVEHFRCPSKAQ